MSELSSYRPEGGNPEHLRTPEEAKRYEAREIAALNEILWDLFGNQISDMSDSTDVKVEADAALDTLASLAESLGQRDPEMARILIEELESGPHAQTDQTISDRLRAMAGLPPWDRGATPAVETPPTPFEHDQ